MKWKKGEFVMNKKALVMAVFICSCFVCSCSKYEHSNTVKVYDTDDTEGLSEEEIAAIKEEEEYMAKSNNIAFGGICDTLKEKGFKEELDNYIYQYFGKNNYIQVVITSKDGEYCSRIRVDINPEYFESDDKDKELSDALQIILSNLDEKFEEASLSDILDIVSNLDSGDDEDYECTGNIMINISKGIEEKAGYSLFIKKNG